MMTIERCAAVTVLVLLTVAAFTVTGCGGGGGVAPAQTGAITGTIVYAATGQPLGDIEVSAGGITTTTRDDGTFTLNGVAVGQHVLQIEIDADRGLVLPPGVDLTVTVQGGQVTQLAAPIQLIDSVDQPPAPPS